MQALQATGAPAGGPPDAPLQFLRFALGREMHAVRIEAVREILEIASLTPLPLMPRFVRGVMNLRGSVVPVIDLGARLGFGETVVGRRTCIVIVTVASADGTASQTLGVLVDAVHEVFDTAAHELEAVPRLGTRIDAGFIRSMVRVRGQAMAELDLERVLDQRTLSELIAAHALH